MPTYEYGCSQCGKHLEVVQSIHDDALTECPNCGGVLRKKFGNVGIVFKGSGFYKTDSRASPNKSSAPGSKTSESSSSSPSGAGSSETSGSGSSGSDNSAASSGSAEGASSKSANSTAPSSASASGSSS